jgi:outer membrane protein assembly factor BamB
MRPIVHTCAVLLVGCGLLAADEKRSDWPQFRGPTGQGVSTDKGAPLTWGPTENVVWKTELPGPGTSTPIIIGSRVFVTCYSGFGGGQGRDMDNLRLHLVCLDRDGGKIRWQKELKPKLPEQGRIREDHGYASSTPAADDERVYVFFGKSGVFAFDHDGKELWQADVGSRLNGWGSAASPVLFGEMVIVNASVESDSMVALDRKTGKEVWRARNIRESWNTPILVPVGGKTELVVAVQGKILAFDPATGDPLWSCATDITWYMVPSMVAHDGVVYCLGGRSGIAALAVRAGGKGDVTRQHRLWTIRKGSNVTSPIYHNGHLYWMNDNTGVAFCAEAKTGNIVYEERVRRADQVYASPVLVDGKIYQVSRSGRVFVLAAKPAYQQLAVNEALERSTFNAGPAVAGGRLFLRSDRHLYCLGGK